MKRRHFLQNAAAVPLIGAASLYTWSLNSEPQSRVESDTLPMLTVVDSRIQSPSGLFDLNQGASTRHVTVDGDVSTLWFSDLKPVLLEDKTVIAGETLGDALFCIQRLAADLGARTQVWNASGAQHDVERCQAEETYRWIITSRDQLMAKELRV